MDRVTMLMTLRDDAWKAVRAAVDAGSIGQAEAAIARVRSVEDLVRRQEALDRELGDLITPGNRNVETSTENVTVAPTNSDLASSSTPPGESPRARGDRRRTEYVKRLTAEGLPLTPYRGALYRNSHGQVIGIAYATERKKDGWFLGLPSDSFDHAILLCERNNGRVFAVCLPKRFFEKEGRQLSRSQGQTKFNVVYRGSHFVMPIPTVGPTVVDQFINNPEPLT